MKEFSIQFYFPDEERNAFDFTKKHLMVMRAIKIILFTLFEQHYN